LLGPAAVPADEGDAAKLRSLLTRLPHAEAAAGACVIEPNSGKVLFEHHADTPMTPASTMKVLTMATGLHVLGAGFSFRTVCAIDGDRLVVIGDGDPGLGDPKLCKARGETVTTVLVRWAKALSARGVTDLADGLVIDESIFDDVFVHPSWQKEDLQKWYAAPVGGLNINDNCVDITVWPDERAGAPVRWSVSPPNDLVRIVNKCTSGVAGKAILHHPHDTFEYHISGQCSKRWPFAPVSFPDPGLLLAGALRRTFADHGVSIANAPVRTRVRTPDGQLPNTLEVVGDHQTPLADVFLRIGKDSENLFAECLLKRTGYQWARRAKTSDSVGSWDTGARAVLDTLECAGIDVTALVVADGSGLSRKNRCTARQLVETLVWVHRRADGVLLRQSLSVCGTDGSLRQSMQDLKGRIVAKTGTMKGVRALAGYVQATANREYAFAILFNGYSGSSSPYKQIQHRFCQILASWDGS